MIVDPGREFADWFELLLDVLRVSVDKDVAHAMADDVEIWIPLQFVLQRVEDEESSAAKERCRQCCIEDAAVAGNDDGVSGEEALVEL